METALGAWRLSHIRKIIGRFFLMCGDLMAIAAAYMVAYQIRFYYQAFVRVFPITKGIPSFHIYLLAMPVILFMWLLSIYWQGAYRRVRIPVLDDGIRFFRAAVMGTILSMSAMFLYRDETFSRLVFGLGGAIGGPLVYLYRLCVKTAYVYWIHSNHKPRRVLIIGDGYLSKSLGRILDTQGDRAILHKKTRDVSELKRTIARSRISEVLVAAPDMDHKHVVQLAAFCDDREIVFRLTPDILEIRLGEVVIDDSLGVPMFQLRPMSLHGSAYITKRIMDVAIASLVIGVFFVPLAVIALTIKLTSPGPIFHLHPRLGYRQKTFQFFKFRSMVNNADKLLEDLKHKSDRKGPVFKMKNDPRVTAIGRFIRRYSLDELPQLINVLKGEMSVVGPRPQVLWEAAAYDDWAKKRLNVLPGITGLWQVSGRAELTYEEMIELDIYYIEHWSPGLDVKILLKTIPAIFYAKGAY